MSERLNQKCFCITLDRDALYRALEHEAGDPDFSATFMRTRAHLLSNISVFISESETSEMLRIVRAIEAATRLPGYQETALSWAPEIARHEFGPRGVFMGYDFHLAAAGPKLIEVNTNAGGAFLNALLARAQRACCAEVGVALGKSKADDFELAVLRMFQQEWDLQQRTGVPQRIAIVDDRPAEQYLYPEFLLARRLFLKHGIETVIADARQLRYERDRLLAEGRPVDLVYNRLVDSSLGHPEHEALRAAYLNGAVVVTQIRARTRYSRTSAIWHSFPTTRLSAPGGFHRGCSPTSRGCHARCSSRPTMRSSCGRPGRLCSSSQPAGMGARRFIMEPR